MSKINFFKFYDLNLSKSLQKNKILWNKVCDKFILLCYLSNLVLTFCS